MTKNELLDKLNKMAIAEEQAMPVYTKHLDAIMSWSDLPVIQRSAIKDILMTLQKESENHMRQLNSLREYVQRSADDVF